MIIALANTTYNYYSSKNIQVLDNLSTQNNQISTIALDKSKALSEVLGYGVDEQGFFTSDFNEAANLPKDYKIYAKNIKSINESLTTTQIFSQKLYRFIDWAKELGIFYKNNLQNFDTNFGQSFNEEQFKNIMGDEVDFHQIKENTSFNANTQENSIDKGSLLLSAFALKNNFLKLNEAQTTLYAKIQGFDANISQNDMNELNKFMQEYHLKDPNNIAQSPFKNIIPDAFISIDKERSKLQNFVLYANDFKLGDKIINEAKSLKDEFDALMSMDLNLQDFKEKYLDFKQRHDEFVKEYEKAMGDKMMPLNIDFKNPEKNANSTPIQAKNNTAIYNFKLTQNQQISNMFSMLFHHKVNIKV